ncbi:MAG: hypothetical protein Q7R95_10865 [bacterium]|nr:hypothetical protein [bacterium]
MHEIILRTYQTRIDAEVDKGFLEASGIKSMIVADDEGGMAPYLLNGTGFVKLQIYKKDYEKACEVLKIKIIGQITKKM